MRLYSEDAIEDLLVQYRKHGGLVYHVEGSLLDNYILVPDPDWSLITTCYICFEVPLNEWSSAYGLRHYERLPKKYWRVIELLEQGRKKDAEKLFFSISKGGVK